LEDKREIHLSNKQGANRHWKTWKTGKMTTKNSLQGKVREFLKSSAISGKNRGIWK